MEYEKNIIYNEFAVKLCLEYEGIADFKNGILTIYLDLITFNDDSDDDLDVILASIDVSDLPPLEITDDILLFVCSMGKSARNKKQPSKNYNMSYNGKFDFHALADIGSNINVMPYRIYKKLGREQVKLKKAIAFLGSLPVPLQHAEWIPNRTRSFDKENGDKKWHAKIKVVDAYGYILNKGLK
nr:hypothetical protein [Tanacetum cinerariifolium]